MKQTKVFFAIVLMSMIANVSFAQDSKNNQSKPAPAVFAKGEAEKYTQYLTTHSAKDMGLEEGDFELFKALFANGNEPIHATVQVAGLVAGRSYAAGDSLCVYVIRTDMLRLFSYPIRSNEKEAAKAAKTDAKLKLAAARAWAVEELNEGRPRSGSEIAAKLSNGQEVTIPTKMSDDFGWSIVGGATYQFGKNNLRSVSGELGIRYDHQLDRDGKWFAGAQVLGSLRKTYLNNNAVDAGDTYVAYGTVADLILGRTFGRHRQFRLSAVVGLNWEFYKTDSQKRVYADGSWDELSSWGNYLSPEAKLMAQYRPVNWGVGFFFSAGVRQHTSVWQNEESQRTWLGTVELGVEVPIFRHVTNN
jgi:hypothetical protein